MIGDLLTARGIRGRRDRVVRCCAAVFLLGALTEAILGRSNPMPGGTESIQPHLASIGSLTVGTLLVLLVIPFGEPMYWWFRRRIPLWRQAQAEPLPLLVFEPQDPDRDETGGADVASPNNGGAAGPAERDHARDGATASPTASAAPAQQAGAMERVRSTAGPEGAATSAEPAEDGCHKTLQLLPGRLEIVSGSAPEAGQEIRFVRAGPVTEVTVGRAQGELPEHVRITAPTVSRRHALFRHAKGRWTVANLSETNPVRLNGEKLSGKRRRSLRPGDRLEIGEVVMVFHER